MNTQALNYEALMKYAGEHMGIAEPNPIHVGNGETVPDYPAAVYVAIGVDGIVLYVGSAKRSPDARGVQARLEEHMRRHERFQTWDYVYVIPLRDETPMNAVRRIEARIGAHLGPSESRALPRLGKRRSRS